MVFRCILLMFIIGSQAGCASWLSNSKSDLAKSGPDPTFKSKMVEEYANNQKEVYEQLKVMTGVGNPSPDQIISAGLQYADARCSDYIESLNWVHRQLKADIREVNSVGTLTTGLMGISKSAATEIAAVAVIFGFSEESLNNTGSRMLFELEPSAIRSLVEGSQKAFRSALQTGYRDRAGAFSVIREYVVLCLPSTIEAEINNAAKNAVQTAASGNPQTGEPPKVSINESQVNVSSHRYDSDVYSLLLKSYAFPGGNKNDAAHAQLQAWISSEGITDPVGIFLMSSNYKEKWKAAVDYLRVSGNPRLK